MADKDERLFWYKLVDINGDRFDGHRKSSLLLTRGTAFEEIRYKVATENKHLIGGIPAASLKVNSRKLELTGEPLNVNHLLGDTIGSSCKDPVLFMIPIEFNTFAAFRYGRFERMTAEESCGMYLDSIATKLSFKYEIHYQNGLYPKIEPGLNAVFAIKGGRWDYSRAMSDHILLDYDGYKTGMIKRGEPYFSTPLTDIFTEEEWNIIRKIKIPFKRKGVERWSLVPTLPNGKKFVILPHAQFTPEKVALFKYIGVKTEIIRHADDVIVLDEDTLPRAQF